ncbi:MAG: glycosyltransferase [Bacteroidales bacterium]|nr:glycosyltransferase [Bacteroidales bacterium]
MSIVFYTNFINHHQLLLADELYLLTNHNFFLVEIQPMFEWLKKNGYSDFSSRPYVIQAWKDNIQRQKAWKLCVSADVALFGADSLNYQVERAKSGKLSFEVSERWLKRGLINVFSPRLLKNMWFYHTLFYKKPVYKLCSSAYAAGDQYKLHSYRDKCYKWGYFTKVEDLDIAAVVENRTCSSIKIMWCSRFIKWKHPEMPIKLAAKLKDKGYDFVIDMYGCGSLLQNAKLLANRLKVKDYVNFCGNLPNEQILQQMRLHDIFLFTSDKNEGWGAVANEAMSNGCVLVASNEIGSIPFLVEDDVNGCIYKSGNLVSLTEKVEYLISSPEDRKRVAMNAYNTLKNIWSPKNAAENLLTLIDDLNQGRDSSILEGPCSIALPI